MHPSPPTPNVKNAQAYLHQVQALYAGHLVESMVTEGLGLRQALSAELMKEMDYSARGALPATGFAQQAQWVARFMRERKSLSIAFMDIGGWDTHAGQGHAQGLLANRLAALGQGIQSFADELEPEWKKTALVVLSEFGRTFRENGSGGTDHGLGNVMWLSGGAIRRLCIRVLQNSRPHGFERPGCIPRRAAPAE